MSIVITKKVDVKMKQVHFENGTLIDEDGVVVDLLDDLKTVYNNNCFDLSATLTIKDEHEVSDFKHPE